MGLHFKRPGNDCLFNHSSNLVTFLYKKLHEIPIYQKNTIILVKRPWARGRGHVDVFMYGSLFDLYVHKWAFPDMGLILMTSGISIYGHKGESYILVTAVSDITLTHILLCETTVDMTTSFVACSDITMTAQWLTSVTDGHAHGQCTFWRFCSQDAYLSAQDQWYLFWGCCLLRCMQTGSMREKRDPILGHDKVSLWLPPVFAK